MSVLLAGGLWARPSSSRCDIAAASLPWPVLTRREASFQSVDSLPALQGTPLPVDRGLHLAAGSRLESAAVPAIRHPSRYVPVARVVGISACASFQTHGQGNSLAQSLAYWSENTGSATYLTQPRAVAKVAAEPVGRS